jgi:hypothetical protein
MAGDKIMINRAPVLTLWAAVVAERLGYDHDTALTLGKAITGLTAQAKGRRLGIYNAPASGTGSRDLPTKSEVQVPLLDRLIPAVYTTDGLRATNKEEPESPAGVTRYLESKFGANLAAVQAAMQALAASYPPERLADTAFGLYERFRPEIPTGKAGWGAAGELDLEVLRRLHNRD